VPFIDDEVSCAIAADDKPIVIATAIAMRLSFVFLNMGVIPKFYVF
jgi:hypothetical protein